jgi:DNA invertase Pin-like site-specific DNA recombinase
MSIAKKKVIELLRLSTLAQAGDSKTGLEAQRAANRRTTEQWGLEIVETVELVGVSGVAVSQDPRYQRLKTMIERPDISGIVCKEFSRLSRQKYDLSMLGTMAETDTLLYLPEGPQDPRETMGYLLLMTNAMMSGLEWSVLRERTMSGKEVLRKKGRWAVSWKCLSYGVAYDRQTYQFSYKPLEAQKLKKVFERALAGDLNYAEHARYLGVSDSSIRRILTNPIYKGYLFISKRRKRVNKNGRSYVIETDRDQAINEKVMQGLISEHDFDRVSAKIAAKAALNAKKITNAVHFAYNGVLFCAKCGARMYTQLKNAREEKRRRGVLSIPARYYYVCSNRLRGGIEKCDSAYCDREKLEDALDWQVAKKLSSPTWLERTHKAYRKQLESGFSQKDLAQTQAQLEKLLAKRQRIEDVYFDGRFDRASLDERLRDVDKEIQEARDTLAEQSQKLPPWNPEEIAEIAAPLSNWHKLDREHKHKLLKSLPFTFHVLNEQVKDLFVGYETPPFMAQNSVLTIEQHSGMPT